MSAADVERELSGTWVVESSENVVQYLQQLGRLEHHPELKTIDGKLIKKNDF